MKQLKDGIYAGKLLNDLTPIDSDFVRIMHNGERFDIYVDDRGVNIRNDHTLHLKLHSGNSIFVTNSPEYTAKSIEEGE